MPARKLRVVTWNVWFGDWKRKTRQAALWAELDRLAPDVICLQEVLPRHLAGPELERRRDLGDWISDTAIREYDIVMLSRVPVASNDRVPLRTTTMGRDLLITRLAGACPLTIASVHLESTSTMTRARVDQLEQITATLADEGDAILVGDMNFDAQADAPENRPLAGWTDAWAHLRPDEPGYTVDTQINHMRHMSKQGRHHQKRIDRVFIRAKRWHVEAIELLGTQSLPGDPLTFISDHFGLCVDLAC
jgi:tyrosyl-DNA phosphodiesterase 2